ncbi:hypothetical protein FOA43_001039 [Brettanomyces nanus]|uniref:non-specific serine/threonine protein kinase n=1 Tax=Eeniella nana TaxID=13502 RepID=A0A875RXE8_EENNA|nr:uncharacterized protein FOA43_001039 [Brettanomyces nanus]QPG73726.1 hypothetical protein FOA43_001039 [Brettanomyces nanus]
MSKKASSNAGHQHGHQAFSEFMEQANNSTTSLISRRNFYLGANESTDSVSSDCAKEPSDSSNGSGAQGDLQNPPNLQNPQNLRDPRDPRDSQNLLFFPLPSPMPPQDSSDSGSPSGSASGPRSRSSSRSLSCSPSDYESTPEVFPLNRLITKGFSVAQNNARHSAERQQNENEAILFTTKSPQSYSYALLSPNSLALRLKVLKRSLEILLERPEWLSGASPIAPTTAATTTSPMSIMPPIVPVASASSTGSPSYGSIPLHMSPSFIRRASTTVNVMDNVMKLEQTATGSCQATPLAQLPPLTTVAPSASLAPLSPLTSVRPATASPVLGSIPVDKHLLEDLKQITHFLEHGTEPHITQDQAARMINLHNLSLSNADVSKKTNLRIQLLHALATPFEERSSVSNYVGGIPMLHSTTSTIGLSTLEGAANTSYNRKMSVSSMNSTGTTGTTGTVGTMGTTGTLNATVGNAGRQFHSSSAGKTKSPKAIFTCELESPWKLLNSNDLACLVFGISRNFVKSLTLMDLIAPRSRNLVFSRLQRHTEQVFSGEVIAIKRNKYDMAWTSLWAKRKDDFTVLIFEQVPCDSLDIVIERDASPGAVVRHQFIVTSAKSSSTLFGRKYTGLHLDEFLPTVSSLMNSDNVPEEYRCLLAGQREVELINKVRYFTIQVDHEYAPCAVTSEELDPDEDDTLEMRLNIHSLPYIAGSFVISSNGYKVVSFNEAIAKNLFGHADFQGRSIDCVIPGFSRLLDKAINDNPGLSYDEGIVLPEHYWRKMAAYNQGKSDTEREIMFLRSTGLDGCHNDGHIIKIDVQMRLIDKDYFILWVTYCRAITGTAAPTTNTINTTTSATATSQVGSSNIDDISKKLGKLNIDNTSSQYDAVNVPSQLPLFPEVAGNLNSTDMSRSSTSETVASETPNHRTTHSTTTTNTASSSSIDLGTESSTTTESSTNNMSSSLSVAEAEAANAAEFKLQHLLTQSELLSLENVQIVDISNHSKYFPTEIGKERRTKKVTDFHVVKNLGQGAYGKVVVAVHNGDPYYKIVLKAIFKERILVDTWVRDKNLGTIPSEIQILNAIHKDLHPNIMRIVDFFEDDNCYYLETLQHGDPPAVDLFDLIEVKTDMTELECKYIYFQCCSALAHLHKHNIVHRDIKDENIIVDKDFVVKLIDFGSAAYTKDGPFGVFVGTIDYAAPEVLNGKPYGGKPQDVWAMGVLLYTLVFKENPFCSVDEILEGNLSFPRFHDISEDCTDLIKSILIEDVNDRPTMKQILKSKWLQGMQ